MSRSLRFVSGVTLSVSLASLHCGGTVDASPDAAATGATRTADAGQIVLAADATYGLRESCKDKWEHAATLESDPTCTAGEAFDCVPAVIGSVPCCFAQLMCKPSGVGYEWKTTCDDSCAQGCSLVRDPWDCRVYGCDWHAGGCSSETAYACGFRGGSCPIDGDCTSSCRERRDEASCAAASYCAWEPVIGSQCLSERPLGRCSRDGDCAQYTSVTGRPVRCRAFSDRPTCQECAACAMEAYYCTAD